ncbi:MAG: ABC transporter substrate-binding protein [Actinomycetota bacterium]|nr:ABC transporter substrate-binding protein [Actinomycetota bacterium]
MSQTWTSRSQAIGVSRRDFLKGAVLLGGGSILAACGGTSALKSVATQVLKPKRGGTLVAGLTGGTASDTLNPLAIVNNVDFARVAQLYDPLVVQNRFAHPEMQLAEEITPNSDATVWTIRLRPGVTFHNGKPLTSEDVLYTFQQVLNPNSPGAGAPSISLVDLASSRIVDPLTLELHCKSPFSTLVDALAGFYFDIIPVGFDPQNPIGTGPFKYQSFTPGQQSTFVRNENYWQSGLPYFDSVVINDYADEATQVNGILSGQVNAVNLLSATSIATLKSNHANVIISDGGGWTPFTMRVDQAPFNDVNVRQAMRLICNRQEMLDLVFQGHGTIGNDIFAKWDPLYDTAIPQREQDLEQARFLLKKAGQENLKFNLVTSNLAQGVESVASVFAQQAKGAGVTVSLDTVTPTEFYGSRYLSWTFAQDYWFYNPYFLQIGLGSLPTSPYNETHWDDARYNKLYNEGIGTVDVTKRAEIAHEMQVIDYNQGGYIIPYFPPVIDCVSSKVQGAVTSKTGIPLNDYDFKRMWFE